MNFIILMQYKVNSKNHPSPYMYLCIHGVESYDHMTLQCTVIVAIHVQACVAMYMHTHVSTHIEWMWSCT